jgi:predicted phage-related endonuclease
MSAPVAIATSEDRPAWLAARRGGATATDIASLGGAAPSRAAMERIAADKRAELKEWSGNKYTRHGNAREPMILEWVARKSRAGGFGSGALIPSHDLFAHPDDHRYLATPDGRSEDWDYGRELVEIKTTVKDFVTIPADYLRQVYWQQFVMGAERTLFVWEVHENFVPTTMEPPFRWIPRDQAAIDDLRAKADILLDFMAGHFPAPDPVADQLITRYLLQKDVVTEASDVLKQIEAEVRAWIGDRDAASVMGTVGDLSFSTSTSRRLSTTALKKDHPDLWEAYAVDTPTSRLTITPLKTDAEEATAA